MVDVMKQVTKTVRTVNRVELDAQDIVSMLRAGKYDIPDNATVTVLVPGGGDWSNMTLDIGVDAPLAVEWVETTQEQS